MNDKYKLCIRFMVGGEGGRVKGEEGRGRGNWRMRNKGRGKRVE